MESLVKGKIIFLYLRALRFGYALGLEKGLYNPNRVVFDTDSKVHIFFYLLPEIPARDLKAPE